MNVFVWHAHGSYTTALVHGPHRYLLPRLPRRGRGGEGRADTWDWPDNAVDVSPADAQDAPVDVVILQRPEELELAEVWLGGRRPGVDVAAVYLEHNAPQGRIDEMRHPVADHPGLFFVHVTRFNAVYWDTGSTPLRVIEHGVVDPGMRFTGEVSNAVVVVNEPVRRSRVAGIDLAGWLGRKSGVVVDLFGMGAEDLGGRSLPQRQLHDEMARRRVYVHPYRWTSLGLSLIEAMHLGLPVVCLAATEVAGLIPPEAGVVSNDLDTLAAGMARFASDLDAAEAAGRAARAAALERFGLGRFLADWDDAFAHAMEVVGR